MMRRLIGAGRETGANEAVSRLMQFQSLPTRAPTPQADSCLTSAHHTDRLREGSLRLLDVVKTEMKGY